MSAEITDRDGDVARVSSRPGSVFVTSVGGMKTHADQIRPRVDLDYTPVQARELAATLLRAADEAEEREPMPSRERVWNVVSFSSAGEEADAHTDEIMVAVERDVRERVARELEVMDGTNLGMSLTRSHAVNVARGGLTPRDTQHAL